MYRLFNLQEYLYLDMVSNSVRNEGGGGQRRLRRSLLESPPRCEIKRPLLRGALSILQRHLWVWLGAQVTWSVGS